jgi:hypothetical protein
MYLLDVLSADKTNEITLLKGLRTKYQALPASLPSELASVLLRTALTHHTRRFESPTYETLITSLTAERSTPGSVASSRSASLAPGHIFPGLPGLPGLTGMALAQMSQVTTASPAPSAPPSTGALESLDDPAGAWRGKGFLLPPPTAPPRRHVFMQMMEEVLGKYWHAAGCAPERTDGIAEAGGDYAPRPAWIAGDMPAPVDWVYLATPLMCCLARPIAVFFTFEKLFERIGTFVV